MKSKPSPRAKFVSEVAQLAGELWDRMHKLTKGEIARVQKAAADALREQLARAFAQDEVTIVQAHETTAVPPGGWPTLAPNVIDDGWEPVAMGGGVRVEVKRVVDTPQGPALEMEGPPMPTEGTCVCGADFAHLRALGMTGHACFGPEPAEPPEHSNPPPGFLPCTRKWPHSGPCAHPPDPKSACVCPCPPCICRASKQALGDAPITVPLTTPAQRRVARRRRNATPAPVARPAVAPADITDDLDAGLATEIGGGARSRVVIRHGGGYDPRKGRHHPDNQDPTLEEPRRSGKAPELGMRPREVVRAHLELTKHMSLTDEDEDVDTFYSKPVDVDAAIAWAEANKLEGVKLEDVDVRSTWVV